MTAQESRCNYIFPQLQQYIDTKNYLNLITCPDTAKTQGKTNSTKRKKQGGKRKEDRERSVSYDRDAVTEHVENLIVHLHDNIIPVIVDENFYG
jgi:hypothetical protein